MLDFCNAEANGEVLASNTGFTEELELEAASSWSICKMLASFDKYPQRLKAYKY